MSRKNSLTVAAFAALTFAAFAQAQTAPSTEAAKAVQAARCAAGSGPFDSVKKYQGTYSFTLDNDLFSKRDQDYTSGFKAGWSSPNVRSFADDDCLPPLLQSAGRLFTQIYSSLRICRHAHEFALPPRRCVAAVLQSQSCSQAIL